MIPRQWKVIQTVREKFSCRECETITQPPAPFHVTPRGFAGPNLLAMILFEKFGQHQPLNRQSHLQDFTGILQPDAYSGYNGLYDPSRDSGAITSALCWAHARRQFFELADIAANARRGKNAAAISPVALEAVKRIDALFDIERGINGLSAEERLRVRQ